MRVMRTDLHRPSAALLLPLLLLVAVLATGCGSGGDDDPASAGSSSDTPTGAADEQPAEHSADADADDRGDDGDVVDDPDAAAAALPTERRAVCAPYLEMVAALEDLDYAAGAEALAAEMAPLMKEWAAAVATQDRPPGMSEQMWEGVRSLAARVVALPDAPSLADLERVERDLTDAEREALEAGSRWLRRSCVAG